MASYSTHAERRMHERGISRVEVDETLEHPLEVRDTRYGRLAA